MPILAPHVPQTLLGDYVKANYASLDVLGSDIIWQQWWDDQGDIVVQFDEVTSNIVAADVDSSSEETVTLVHIHVFVRDFNVHSVSPTTEINLDLIDMDVELNVPSKLQSVVIEIVRVINDNPEGLYNKNIKLMEADDPFEAPVADWDQEVYRNIIPVRLTYVEN
jgi:hypothetical protein